MDDYQQTALAHDSLGHTSLAQSDRVRSLIPSKSNQSYNTALMEAESLIRKNMGMLLKWAKAYPGDYEMASLGDKELAHLLTAKIKPNMNKEDRDGNCTWLMTNIILDEPNFVKTLILIGANLDKQNYLGTTALMITVRKGHADTVNFLIKAGAKLDTKDNNGWTATQHLEKRMLEELENEKKLSENYLPILTMLKQANRDRIWREERLVLIGKNDKNSTLNILPKDVIHEIRKALHKMYRNQ